MIIRYIKTENFLSHEKEEIALPSEGTFLLSGESGAGKSSFIVDAVAYALFGALATRAKKQNQLIRTGADKMSVQITFDLPDIRLTLARGIDERGSSWSRIWDSEKDEILAEGVAATGRVIRQYLGGITWQQFYAAFVARQSEIALLTSLRGSERKNLVQRMLGMRELEKAGEIIYARLRRSFAERDQLEKTLGGIDLLSEEEALAREKEELSKIKSKKESMSRDLEGKRLEKQETENALKPLLQEEARWRREQKTREEQAKLRAELEIAEEKLRAHAEAEKFLQENKIPDLSSIEKERDELRDLFRRSKETLELQNKIKDLPRTKGEPLSFLKERIITLRAENESIKESLLEKENSLNEIKTTGKCSLCKRDTGHAHDDIVESLQEDITELAEKQKEKEKEEKALQERIPQAEREEEAHKKESMYLERIKALESEGVDEDLARLEARGKEISDQVKEETALVQKASLFREKLDPAIEERVQVLRSGILKDDLRISEPQSIDEIREKLQSITGEENALQGELKGLTGLLEEKENNIEQKEKKLSSLHQELSDLQQKRKRVQELEKMQSYLRAYQKYLAHEIRPALEEVGSEMLQRISGGKHKAMHIDDNYEIEVEDRDGNLLRSSMISGGEAIRANICLRLALTRLVSQRTGVPIAFLVFDEPLPAQDAGHIERILELLASLRPFYRQQFIISHVGDLKSNDAIDYIIDFASDGDRRVHLFSA